MNPWISLALTFFIFALLIGGGILAFVAMIWLAVRIVRATGRRKKP